jgi:hypothetical protein
MEGRELRRIALLAVSMLLTTATIGAAEWSEQFELLSIGFNSPSGPEVAIDEAGISVIVWSEWIYYPGLIVATGVARLRLATGELSYSHSWMSVVRLRG